MSTPTTEASESPELELEGQIVGEYVVEGRVGRGAFGTVYKGVHPLIGKAVAIKVLARRFSADPEMVSRFVAEARAVNQIRHRHIIDIFSFGQLEDGRHYYVMEYLEGETLQALLEREHRIPLAQCFTILHAIGRALDAAHAKGIAHRDLKAENVFLGIDSDGGVWPKLLDFGIAKLINTEDGFTHKTRSGMSIGTPRYMSPEQCHGRQVDHRTDIYAFGILVYLMLTGVFPFDGESYMEILMKQVGAAAVPPSAHVAELPAEIDDVVLWLIHKDPTQRPPDLKTAVMVLEQAAERAGLVAPAAWPTAWLTAWDATSGQASTQSAAIVVPPGVRAPRRGASATTAEPFAVGRGASTSGRRVRDPGSFANNLTADAATAPPCTRKAPILAVTSLVAIMASVAAAVALYPRAGHVPARPVQQPVQAGLVQVQPQAPLLLTQVPGQGGPGRGQTPAPLSSTQLPGRSPERQAQSVRSQPASPKRPPAPAGPSERPLAGKRATKDDLIDVFGGEQP
jgi:eukaryotic-like serine/threonine-protein kinase